MSSSYLNMAAGAFLGTCFVAMTLSIVSGSIYYSPNPEKEGFVIKAEKTAASGESKSAKPEIPPIAPLLQKADVKKGAQIFKKCEACHNGDKGGPNKIGPNLWGVVGRPIASHPGFSYSSALKKFSEDGKKNWDYQLLNHFIHGPREYVSGTAMTFPGVKDNQDRADVIAYLHTLSDNPVPFPKPEAAGGKADAGGKNGKSDAAGAKASGDQTSKPAAAPSDKAPAKSASDAGSKEPSQSASDQNKGAGQGAPATQKPAANQ